MALSTAQMALEEFVKRGYTVKRGCITTPSGKQRKLRKSKNGYYFVQFQFRVNGVIKQSQIFVHRLVAYSKFGKEELFKHGIVVRHLDDVKHNNSWQNIDIGTHEDNRRDAEKNGKKFCRKGFN